MPSGEGTNSTIQTTMTGSSLRTRGATWYPESSPLVEACGDVVEAIAEDAREDHQRDHVWISLNAGVGIPVEVAINTRSLKNAVIGADPRVRLGVARSIWVELPPRGLRELKRFDYAEIEQSVNVFHEHWERDALEVHLISAANSCVRLQVWGMPYHRRKPGIHQVHSRRASCAVASDIAGLDGGMRFYFGESPGRVELWMFKFCGQP